MEDLAVPGICAQISLLVSVKNLLPDSVSALGC